MSEKDVIALDLNSGIDAFTEMDAKDTWQVNAGAGSDAAATIGIEACGDMSGFNDDMVTFSFVAKSLAGVPTGYGNVAAGADLVVTVRSEGEDKPTVSFSTDRVILIDEGDTNTVAIIADGKLGPEVGSVMVSMSGDAMLSLWQGEDMLEADADGMYAVDLMRQRQHHPDDQRRQRRGAGRRDDQFGDPHDRERQRRDHRRPRLADGDRHRLHGGRGAAAARSVALALFLMAGGARLYRRRNG